MQASDALCNGDALTVGAPRSGFALLGHTLNVLFAHFPEKRRPKTGVATLKRVEEISTLYLTARYRQTFARFGITDDLVFNGEFHRPIGGPKWLDKANPKLARIRKYFGVRGMGDFLLVTSHPRQALETDPVLHSHTSPALWLAESYYDDLPKFTSIRNPIGIVNSSCFSLNAMASEYVQKFMPNESEDFIRQRHGLYKLTDLDFVRGLTKFLRDYLEEYLPVKDRYTVMKWEDLIQRPVKTIRAIARTLGISCSDEQAEAIWKPMDHVNLLRHHKHNYRHGKGIVGDWKNSLINEHLALFREFDFDRYLKELGYPPLPELDRREYTPYQRLIEQYVSRGEVYSNVGDRDLFGFAFNKSNIDASKFGFKSFPKRPWTHVERSTFSRDDVVEAVSDTAEDACTNVNDLYGLALAGTDTPQRALYERCVGLMREIDDPKGLDHCERLFSPAGARQ